MKLGVDYRGAQSGGGSGTRGIGRYTLELVLGILNHAPEIEVILFYKHDMLVPDELKGRCQLVPVVAKSWSDAKKPLWLKIPKIRSIKRFHEMRFRNAERQQKHAMELALSKHPIDLLHIPSALDIGSYPIYEYPCPCVMTFLDAIVVKLKDITLDRYPWFLQTYYFDQVKNLSRASRIVAISGSAAQDGVELFGLNAEKIDVVYPAVPRAYGDSQPRPSSVQDFPYFLFCSVPDPHKNPDIVIRAFTQVPKEYKLVFVSPKDSPLTVEAIKLAADSGLSERFLVTGYVSEAELIGLFQHATALVSPSQMEGFGLPVAQAMRAGTPVVTSKFSAQGEIAEGVGYLVDPNSVEELASAMLQVVSDGRDPVRIGKGIERAKLFDVEKVTTELVECYRKSIKG